eukprot:CAMPEP_0172617232 /NCGR_PEP_ID=MMETSP1068-20121228/70126_1 /TAXON_ID=35684 /ORGANISM="Pseudopedinella elastica, Strain CCMP716" /LENGTH=125 /DNA_ID=CAMNT_0013422945 /DNA_START=52 /DNA_END=429 /DNA_ORIENTATION=-
MPGKTPAKARKPKGIVGLLAPLEKVLRKSMSGASKISKHGAGIGHWLSMNAARWAWIGACSTMLVLVPILFEVQREQQCLTMERLMVEDLKKQGYTDQDLAHMGYSTVIAPAVGLNDMASGSSNQ